MDDSEPSSTFVRSLNGSSDAEAQWGHSWQLPRDHSVGEISGRRQTPRMSVNSGVFGGRPDIGPLIVFGRKAASTLDLSVACAGNVKGSVTEDTTSSRSTFMFTAAEEHVPRTGESEQNDAVLSERALEICRDSLLRPDTRRYCR